MNSPAKQPVAGAPRDTELKDPTVPIWLIVVLFLLLFWGAVYFDDHGGWFEKQVYTPYVSADQLKDFQVGGGPNPFEQGRVIYSKTCFACHGANGMGQPGNVPPLVGSDWVNEPQPGRMIRIVLNGLQGTGLTIHGQPFNTGTAMVPWKSFSDEDIAAVITFVRGNPDFKNHAPPVTPEQVKAIRDKIEGTHPGSFSPAEIEAVNPAD
ncbi:MAG TPA: cytochrome c [Candidatus Angelobacter sp.]|nr:cytochrome c [Candidatus Angelobacter sp.]